AVVLVVIPATRTKIEAMFRRLVAMAVASTVVLAMCVTVASAAPAGDLDPTFSVDGKQTTNFTAGFDSANAVAVQIDLKIVAVGQSGGSGGQFALARYLIDGSLDTAGFGGGTGKVTTDFTAGYDAAYDGVLDPDGNIVAVGRAGRRGGRFAVASY